ncbi:hypothetical protein AAFF_G00058520 [Aldrovandia affinis]|uniref:Uncharacterized protein n=1 Tax=Aldrovandia affinis TaxID=143900 RepID=A0AAD7S0G7_9TELE|nr:hypothetical protein AAFF_G00058520 [Aldrovandia affinis]
MFFSCSELRRGGVYHLPARCEVAPGAAYGSGGQPRPSAAALTPLGLSQSASVRSFQRKSRERGGKRSAHSGGPGGSASAAITRRSVEAVARNE